MPGVPSVTAAPIAAEEASPGGPAGGGAVLLPLPGANPLLDILLHPPAEASSRPPPVRAVPSDAWPTVAVAVEEAEDGTRVEVAAGHRETLRAPLILDRAVLIEGPADDGGGPAPLLFGEEGLVVAAGKARNRVVLRRLRLRIAGGAPALVIVGGCTVEQCEIEASGVGVEVAAPSGNAARLLRTVVRGCQVGISLAGSASAAVVENCRVEGCACGIAVTGLSVGEGWSAAFGSFADVQMEGNAADLRIQGWSVEERATGVVRQAPPGKEVTVQGWPQAHCSVVAPTDHGPVVLHIKGGGVNATLFEDSDQEGASGAEGEDDEVERAPP